MSTRLLFIGGSPGTGKTTVSKLLQEKLNSPYIDFGWLREFHLDREWKNANDTEEQMAFENLVFMLKNYIKNGYENVIVTDLLEKRIAQLHELFHQEEYKIFTLTVSDNNELKRRVLEPTRDSGYRNYEEAIAWNRRETDRTSFPNEITIDTFEKTPEEVAYSIIKQL
ncbi:MAG: AAA family ATPase [Patescibacteria group bacterium]